MWSIVLRVVVVVLALRLLVWWLEPRMAFFPTPGVQETPAVAGIPFRDVRVTTVDGEQLHGWWMEHAAPRAQIIFFHGNGGNLSMWLDIFVQLRRRGFSVLVVDYRGYGASSGSASERGLYRDADATVDVFHRDFRRPGRQGHPLSDGRARPDRPGDLGRGAHDRRAGRRLHSRPPGVTRRSDAGAQIRVASRGVRSCISTSGIGC